MSELLERRQEAVMRLQRAADDLAAALIEANDLGVQAWALMNPRPAYIFPTIAQHDLALRMSVYLFGKSNGSIGRSGETPVKSLQRPDPVTEAADAARRMRDLHAGNVPAEVKEAA